MLFFWFCLVIYLLIFLKIYSVYWNRKVRIKECYKESIVNNEKLYIKKCGLLKNIY